jgi:hypothetical protein
MSVNDRLIGVLLETLTEDQKGSVVKFIQELATPPRTRQRRNGKLQALISEIAEVRSSLTAEEEHDWKIGSFNKLRIRTAIQVLLGETWETQNSNFGITKEHLRNALSQLSPELDGKSEDEEDEED